MARVHPTAILMNSSNGLMKERPFITMARIIIEKAVNANSLSTIPMPKIPRMTRQKAVWGFSILIWTRAKMLERNNSIVTMMSMLAVRRLRRRALMGFLTEDAVNMATDVMMSKTRTRTIITKNITQNAINPPILKCDPDGSEVLLVEMLLVRFSINVGPLYALSLTLNRINKTRLMYTTATLEWCPSAPHQQLRLEIYYTKSRPQHPHDVRGKGALVCLPIAII